MTVETAITETQPDKAETNGLKDPGNNKDAVVDDEDEENVEEGD